MRQLATALAAVGVGLAATGCATTINGSPALAGHTGPLAAPHVAVVALDRSLLSTAEVNGVMAATRMTVHTSRQNMWDDSPGVADMNCLAVDGPAEDKIYAGRGWTAIARPRTPRTRGFGDALRPPIRRRAPVRCRCRRLLHRVVEELASLLQPAIYLHTARARQGVDHSAGLRCHRHAGHFAGP